jgi:hypothetical protein
LGTAIVERAAAKTLSLEGLMTMLSRISLLAMLACWPALYGRPLTAATVLDVRIEHVTIVSPERASPLRDAEVYTHDGRIASITTSGAPSPAADAASTVTTIDGKGLYLRITFSNGEPPGFWAHQDILATNRSER